MWLSVMITGGCEVKENDLTKERIFRRLLEMKAREKGYGHPETWELVDRVANYLEKIGDRVGSVALRTKYAAVHLDYPGSAVHLNTLALDWRQIGRPYEAELLLRQAWEIETRVLSPDSETHPHRLNNLSTVLIMQGKLAESKGLLRRAWELMKGRHDTTSARILLSRLTISLLESKPPGIYIGRLTTLLQDRLLSVAGIITTTTRAAVTVDYLKSQLSGDNFEFLHALYRVINNEEETDKLGKFELWRKYLPAELDLTITASSA